MAETGLIDRAALDTLLESVGGDTEFLVELVGEYFDDAPRQFSLLRAALSAGDSEAFRRAAHSLKSNSATFGAADLSAMCRELEYMGRDGALDGSSERIVAAEAAFAAAKDALTAIVEG